MTVQAVAIDGLAIQSERLRELRLQQCRFSEYEVFIFVPEPGRRGASEAFISARTKQHVFLAVGFRCSVCRTGEAVATRAIGAIQSGKAFYIVQRPLEYQELLPCERPYGLDLDAGSDGTGEASALADTVGRIVHPFIQRRRCGRSSEVVRIRVLGSKGFFGSQIMKRLAAENVDLWGIDIGDDASALVDSEIVISAIGKPAVISRNQLGRTKDLLVDVGYTYDERLGQSYGDFDHSCYEACEYYTPVPGGVGPLQALTLVERAASLTGYQSFRPWQLALR